jgi:hypothetical protein
MKLEESKLKDKSIYSVIKIIRQDIEEKVGNLSDREAVIEYLNGINAILGPPPPPPPPLEPAESKEISQEEKEIVVLEQQIEQLMSKKKEIKAKLGGNETSKEAEVVEVLSGVLKVPVEQLRIVSYIES